MNADKPVLRKQLNWKALFTHWIKAIIFSNLPPSAFICVYLRFNC